MDRKKIEAAFDQLENEGQQLNEQQRDEVREELTNNSYRYCSSASTAWLKLSEAVGNWVTSILKRIGDWFRICIIF